MIDVDHKVKHETFGVGKITYIDDKIVQVKFDIGGVKKFGYPNSIVNGILEIIDEES